MPDQRRAFQTLCLSRGPVISAAGNLYRRYGTGSKAATLGSDGKLEGLALGETGFCDTTDEMGVTKISIASAEGRSESAPDSHSLWIAARVPRTPERKAMDAVVKKFPEAPDAAGQLHAARPSRAEAEAAVTTLLRWIGEDPAREGLVDTPARVVKAYEELFGGYRQQPGDVLGRTFQDVSGYEDMVLVRDVDFHSHCEHHMVPIIGKAHVAYVPDGRVLGLSKIARLVDMYGRRLQTQESMTAQIAQTIVSLLKPKGVAVMIDAEHLCMSMRGIRSKGSSTVTTAFDGTFRDDPALKDRFMKLAGASA